MPSFRLVYDRFALSPALIQARFTASWSALLVPCTRLFGMPTGCVGSARVFCEASWDDRLRRARCGRRHGLQPNRRRSPRHRRAGPPSASSGLARRSAGGSMTATSSLGIRDESALASPAGHRAGAQLRGVALRCGAAAPSATNGTCRLIKCARHHGETGSLPRSGLRGRACAFTWPSRAQRSRALAFWIRSYRRR